MFTRFIAVSILGVISGLSGVFSPALADTTTLQCSETNYNKNGGNPYEVPHYFIMDKSVLWGASKLRWDDKKVDLSVITDSPTTIEASGKATDYMPLPAQIDQCVNDELVTRPDLRDANGAVNIFTVLECTTKAEKSEHEIPIDVKVTINRVTGNLKIIRRQDKINQHDTEHYGVCKASKPVF